MKEKWNKLSKKQKFVIIVVGGLFIMGLMGGADKKTSSNSNVDTPKVTDTAQKQEQKSDEKQHSTVQPTTQPKKVNKPKISFTGNIEPTIARVGQKVVMSFEIENLDDTHTIDGVRVLFANEDFIKKGLTIVNVMNGYQDGRAFEFNNTLVHIPPKEKRTLIIVASAKERGTYESAVTFRNSRDNKGIQFEEPSEGLNGKIVIL